MSTPVKSSARLWLAIATIFSVLWAICLVLFLPGPPEPTLESSGTSEPASFSWKFVDLEDRPATLAQFRGKTIFLNIWATWCAPCVKEMPSIARLADEPRLKDRGIEFLCISTDDTTEAVRWFLQGRGWNMKFFRADSIPPVFLTNGIPATFIIAPDGRIAAKEDGAAAWYTPETIALLEKLAAESPHTP